MQVVFQEIRGWEGKEPTTRRGGKTEVAAQGTRTSSNRLPIPPAIEGMLCIPVWRWDAPGGCICGPQRQEKPHFLAYITPKGNEEAGEQQC